MSGSGALEVLSGLGQGGVAHQVLPVLELAALLQQALGVGLRGHATHLIRVYILARCTSHRCHIIPIDLELGDSGLLGEDVAVEALDYGLGGRVLVELGAVILHVHVVADAQELLAVLVAARQQDGGDAHDVIHWQLAVIRCVALSVQKSIRSRSSMDGFKNSIEPKVSSEQNQNDDINTSISHTDESKCL